VTESASAVPGSVTVAELLSRADAGEPLLLLDVRNDEEWQAWRLEGRRPIETVHIPYFDFIEDPAACVERLPRQRDIVAAFARQLARAYPKRATKDDQTALTMTVWTGRILGISKNVTLPLRMVWAITGNNVSVDGETLSMVDTGLRYQLATESMNNKFRILHDSMRQDL